MVHLSAAKDKAYEAGARKMKISSGARWGQGRFATAGWAVSRDESPDLPVKFKVRFPPKANGCYIVVIAQYNDSRRMPVMSILRASCILH